MSGTETVVLGAIAGLTIFLGLPLGRVRGLSMRMRALLNAGAAGVLIFLFSEVVESGLGPIDDTLEHAVKGSGSWGDFAGHAAAYGVLFAIGLVGLVYYDHWLLHRKPKRVRVEEVEEGVPFGPGAAAVGEYTARPAPKFLASDASRLAFFIALGIGLHNFSEGLAIGQSAAAGKVSLAVLLIIGFGMHNATEGFGIIGPMAGAAERPSWAYLGALGLIGGGPTFLGTLIGQSFVNDFMYMSFLALAAGSILYVVLQLAKVGFKLGHEDMLVWGLFLGFAVGLATELFIEAVQI
ncbi:MAG TPA: ZIP family metal transporter [Acidimicrobiia bacterium]|nr:ZIP family metal transporter [Acidimicrobiia bacterium]